MVCILSFRYCMALSISSLEKVKNGVVNPSSKKRYEYLINMYKKKLQKITPCFTSVDGKEQLMEH